MAQANIDALLAEIARIKESLRIKNQSLANINPNYEMNRAYVDKLESEIASLNDSLANAESTLESATTPARISPTRANTETSVQDTPYDNEGNLNIGWEINEETGEPYRTGTNTLSRAQTIEEDPYEAARLQAENEYNESPTEQAVIDVSQDPQLSQEEQNKLEEEQSAYRSLLQEQEKLGNQSTKIGTTAVNNTRSQATQQDLTNFYATGDWRVRLSLAPSANYLYKNKGNEGILLPLAATNGILFPYTPAISVNYAAHYDPFDLTHSNYKAFQYKNSSVDQVSITCDFTAQDTFEANYLLAVIHFLRSVTKMFYGKDSDPINGTPPPLCYLTGLGSFQFDRHPLAVTSFNYTLPTDVDYIRATSTPTNNGGQTSNNVNSVNSATQQTTRTETNKVPVGGQKAMPDWKQIQSGSKEPTYVPTKMQIQIQAVPIVSRNDISRRFSLKEYGTGKLLRGSKNNTGGIW